MTVEIEDTGHEWYDGNLLPLVRTPDKLVIATLMRDEVVYSMYRIENWSPAITGSDRTRASIGAQLAVLKAEELEQQGDG